MKFSKKEMQKTAKKIRQNIKHGKGRPSKVKMVDTDGKTHNLKKKQYYGLFKQSNIFRLHHSRMPNTTTYVGKAKTPIIINYQDTGYTCCPASMNMCLQGLFDWQDEAILAKLFHTQNPSGTDPSEMMRAMKKLGYKVTPIDRNLKGVKKAFDKGYSVLGHIDTAEEDCMGYRKDKNFGHFINIARVTKKDNYRIYDPTKGVKSCKPSTIDKAMLGRKINYYAVIPI